jgi:hypothetical protein
MESCAFEGRFSRGKIEKSFEILEKYFGNSSLKMMILEHLDIGKNRKKLKLVLIIMKQFFSNS